MSSFYLLLVFSVALISLERVEGFILNEFDDGVANLNLRILGGENATEMEFPFMVSLQMKSPAGDQYHFCGGSIYNVETIVTSASCVYQRLPSQIEVVAGAINLTSPESQRRTAIYLTPHPDYDPEKGTNDVALIALNRALQLDSHVQLMALPSHSHPQVYDGNCTVLGWGSQTESESGQLLQKLNMTLVSLTTCASIYENLIEIDPGMVCARGTISEKTQGPCTGDAGSPLICNQIQDEGQTVPVVAGIVSWSMLPCGNSGYPSIYTNVTQLSSSKFL